MFTKRINHVIRLKPSDVQDFVNAACRCDFDIDISYNRYVVDAKSILGILGMDLTRPLTVSYYGYDSDFENYLRCFALAV